MFGRENPRAAPHFGVRTSPPMPGTLFWWPVSTPPAWGLALDGSLISRGAYSTLLDILNPVRGGIFVNGANTITGVSSTVDMFVGMPIEGPGIPAATTIATITAGGGTMSANFTGVSGGQGFRVYRFGAGDGATTWGLPDDRGRFPRSLDVPGALDTLLLTATTGAASALVTALSSTVGLFVGQSVTGAAIPGGTTILTITGLTTLTLSANASGTNPLGLTFKGRQPGTSQAQDVQPHIHSVNVGASAGGAAAVIQATSILGTVNSNSTGNTETRPVNRAYLACIAY